MSKVDSTPVNSSDCLPQASVRRASGIGQRAGMIFGFSALLLLMVILAFDSIQALHDLETSSAGVRQAYLSREESLRKIRVSLYESGNLLREYTLTNSTPETRDSYLAQVHDMRDHANAEMENCLRESPPQIESSLQKLSNELQSYWLAADHTMSAGVHKDSQAQLHKAAIDRRGAVLAITNEVSRVNELELHLANAEISNLFMRSRNRIQNFTALAFGVGLLLAVSSIIYTSRLENHARQKYLEGLAYERELKDLSKRLVDAQEDERRSISRELHDQIAQTLGAVLINVRALIEGRTPSDPTSATLKKIGSLAEDCLHKVRNMSLLLRPSMLDDLGLMAALEWQAREVSRRNGLLVQVVDHDFDDDLPEELKTCIYRIVQEALNNCTAHAHASRVWVSLEEDPEFCILTIQDNGVGFDPSRNRGMGLLGMHERVARLGGTLAIDSAPGKGTRIRGKIPLASSRQKIGSAL